MFKLLVLSGVGVVASAGGEKRWDAVSHVKVSAQKMLQMGAPVSSEQLSSAAAVSGDWLELEHGDVSCGGDPFLDLGYRMGVCVENYEEDSAPSTYSIYTCTEDSATSNVIVSRTTYTDSDCTAGASTKGSQSYKTYCNFGLTARCTADSMYEDSNDRYSHGGLAITGYPTAITCAADAGDSTLYSYFGARGCVYGAYFGDDYVKYYSSADCSGTEVLSLSYAFVLYNCTTPTIDDDVADDDGEIVYDGMYETFDWNENEDDDDVCFHVDSKINYKGVEYTYEELKAGKEPECTVPHSPSSKGVIITTSCDKTVRVTDTHLLATTKGFQLAYSLKAGDVLFGDYGNENENESEKCTVISVEKEKTTQQYFGLNCVHSEVLASGLRASTFGDFHTLPSWYMTYVGSVLGADTASALGDYVAEWYYQK